MTFTLRGRIQTRLFVLATVGIVWTAIVTPWLPTSSLAQMGMANTIMTKFMTTIPIGPQQSVLFLNYQMGFETLGIMAGLGLAWEFVYNWLQRFRWDDDWPPFFMLIQIVPEAVLLWYVSHLMGVFPQGPLGFSSPEMLMYVLHVSTLWVVIWLFLLGPMRVLAPWWRFESGVLIRPNPGTARYRKSSPAWQEILAGKGALVPSSSEIGEKS